MNRGPNILLVNTWHDDNKGDSAIAEATISLLLERWPAADIALVSLLHDSHPGFASAYRHLQNRFPDLRIHGSPIPKLHVDRNRNWAHVRGALSWVERACRGLVALAAPQWSTPMLDPFERADLVIANGGHTLYSRGWRPTDWIRLYRVMFPMLIARRLGTPYAIGGQSLGPFGDSVGRAWVRSVLRNAQRVVVREGTSHEIALDLGVPEDRLEQMPDMAFALQPRPSSAVDRALDEHRLSNTQFWVITVRQAYARKGRRRETERFLREMEELIRGALDRAERVAIVAHTLGPISSEDDRIPSRSLYEPFRDDDRVVLVEEDFAPSELATLYGRAELVVGTRFHSVILALIAGTPSFAISYFGPKTHGIMRSLDMEDLCADMHDFDAVEALARIDARDPSTLRPYISERVSAMREELRQTMSTLRPRQE